MPAALPNAPQPLQVHRRDVAAREVGETYLCAELHKILPSGSVESIAGDLRQLADSEFRRLLMALSEVYRDNLIHQLMRARGVKWNDETWTMNHIRIISIKPSIDKYLSRVGYNAHDFIELINDLNKRSRSVPLPLREFLPRDTVPELNVILRVTRGTPYVFDGIHRLVALGLMQRTSVRAFVARVAR